VDIVDLEERNRPRGMTLEKVKVGVAGSVKLNLVSFGRGELDRRRLLEAPKLKRSPITCSSRARIAA
jgi:hypothetical protein